MPEGSSSARRLVVVVPALNERTENWSALQSKLAQEPALAGSRWLLLDHGRRLYSIGEPERAAVTLRARIDQEVVAYGPFDDIVLVGHSIGGLLVRSAFVFANGADPRSPQPSPWARNVSRIILFASVNRGIDPKRKWYLRVANWLARASWILSRLTVWQLFRGSRYITNLRIQWIRLFAELGSKAPAVIQLLGTEDDLVTREDSVDIEQFATGYYIEVPGANHSDLHRLDKADDAVGRYALLRDAFVHSVPMHAQNVTIEGPGKVVFVLHGIRADNRTWVEDTVSLIGEKWPDVHAIGPDYGFMSALKFAIPMVRRRYLRWFQDQYTEALARNPKATFHFIGHSNGTYLFGESLRSIPGMRFERAVLVGTVLPAEFDWQKRVSRGQIKELRIDGSSSDWPVAWLCRALRAIGMHDIGTAGFEGFRQLTPPLKREFLWYAGGHSAPLEQANLPHLATFAIDGEIVPPANLCRPKALFSATSRLLDILAPLGGVLCIVAFAAVAHLNFALALALFAVLLAIFIFLDVL